MTIFNFHLFLFFIIKRTKTKEVTIKKDARTMSKARRATSSRQFLGSKWDVENAVRKYKVEIIVII